MCFTPSSVADIPSVFSGHLSVSVCSERNLLHLQLLTRTAFYRGSKVICANVTMQREGNASLKAAFRTSKRSQRARAQHKTRHVELRQRTIKIWLNHWTKKWSKQKQSRAAWFHKVIVQLLWRRPIAMQSRLLRLLFHWHLFSPTLPKGCSCNRTLYMLHPLSTALFFGRFHNCISRHRSNLCKKKNKKI